MQQPKTALITGATGGLGIQLCREFARHGYHLIITARNPSRLRNLAARLRAAYAVAVTPIAADLNQEDAVRRLYEKIQDAGIAVNVLVNNAGFGLGGPYSTNKLRLQDAMIRVNILAPTRLCRLFLPEMLKRGHGGILNVGSIGGFMGGPGNAVYCASKAYVVSLSEALADETRGSGVRVMAVCPGPIHTGFAKRANMESTLLSHYGVMDARQVAALSYRAFACGQGSLFIPGFWNFAAVTLGRLIPRCVSTHVSGILQKQFAVEG